MITTSTSAPLIVVVGATGNQGGSVVNAFLDSPQPYRIRGFTRDLSKEKSQSLISRGVEMVEGDISKIDGKAEKGFEGAEIVFFMTNFWEHRDKQRETSEGIQLLNYLSKLPSVHTIIFSGLPNVTSLSSGKYQHVDHFDGKADIVSYARSIFPSDKKVKFIDVQPGFFASNFTPPSGGFAPRKVEDGRWEMISPMSGETEIPVLDIERDYGTYVLAVVEKGEEVYGKEMEVRTCGEMISMEQLASKVGEVYGKEVSYKHIPSDVYLSAAKGKGLPDVIAQELLEMMLYYQDYGYYGSKKITPIDQLNRKPRSWEEFLRATEGSWKTLLN